MTEPAFGRHEMDERAHDINARALAAKLLVGLPIAAGSVALVSAAAIALIGEGSARAALLAGLGATLAGLVPGGALAIAPRWAESRSRRRLGFGFAGVWMTLSLAHKVVALGAGAMLWRLADGAALSFWLTTLGALVASLAVETMIGTRALAPARRDGARPRTEGAVQ